jgi:hypothetical protein
MSSGKVKCTCGWSWNKSDSSKKDMYICHECGRDNSNNMKNGGWLDNYNDSEVSLPEGYVGEGYSTKGRNYSPAWGGQFEDGGSVYPVNYVPQAQWGLPVGPLTPLALSAANKVKSWWNDDEPVKPIKQIKKPVTQGKPRTLNIVDPRKKMATTNQPLRPNSDLVGGKYSSNHLDKLMQEAKRQKLSKQDMMTLSAMGFQETKWGKSDGNIGHVIGNWKGNDYYQKFISAYKEKMKEADRLGITDPATRLQVYNGMGTVTPKTEKNYHRFEMQKIYGVPIPKGGINMKKNPLYGKQVMDIRDNVLAKNPEYLQYMDSIYKAPVPAYIQDVRMNKQKPPKNIQGRPQLIQPLLAPLKKKEMGGSIPGAVGFSYARTQSPAPSNGPYAKKTKASAKDGEIIKDDMGQWAHPGEITEIGSNQITMEGVPYPVLGISDTGDIQMMYPEEDYEFDGESVTEYPMAKNGIRQEQKGLVNLDQLTNFTNYNKKQPGGWLNKYN